jgi:hypothetical protein
MGPETFIDWVKGKYYALKADQEVPQAKDLAPAKSLLRIAEQHPEIFIKVTKIHLIG